MDTLPTRSATVADFVEDYADDIFSVDENCNILIEQENLPIIRARLIELFKTPHTLKACNCATGLIVPGTKYNLLSTSNVRAPLAMVLKSEGSEHYSGEFCISVEEFINCFSDAKIPNSEIVNEELIGDIPVTE